MSITLGEAKYILASIQNAGLDKLSIDNLKCHRVTRDCIRFLMSRVPPGYPTDLYIAEELNGLLEAGSLVKLGAAMGFEVVPYFVAKTDCPKRVIVLNPNA